jgi:replication factor A1
MKAKEISERFAEKGVVISQEKIQEKMDELSKFKVPELEVSRTVIRNFEKETGIRLVDVQSLSVEKITEEGKWISLRAKVIQLWESTSSDSISQVGLIGDETGVIKFTIWKTAGIDIKVSQGNSYIFQNVVTGSFSDKMQIAVTSTSQIIPIAEEIQQKEREITHTGVIVNLTNGSGLIKRCPECSRSVGKGSCAEHGKVDGLLDIRIKAVLDDGKATYNILALRDMTARLTGLTLDSAKKIATEALDQSAVTEAMKKTLIGKYFTIRCVPIGANHLVTDVEVI